MTSSNLEIEGLQIFTLNCWGLRYVSDHRQLRIKLIAQHLSEHDYDIVFLQEVWIQSDFDYIRTKTKSIYKFAHMFNNASILGTSGLVILTKWIPQMIHFHPYSINGSPFRPFHGDWFSTKGVAYVRIEIAGLNLHLFSTHMHAQYDVNEKMTDQYSIHRICQSYELAKFINLMSCNCSNTSSRDLIIMAGDMNTSSKELPYKLLVEMTDLKDCYKCELKKKTMRKKETTFNCNVKKNAKQKYHCSDESSDEDLITCGHRENTFTPQPSPKSDKFGKRIDFILYKLRDSNLFNLNKFSDYLNVMMNDETAINSKFETSYMSCLAEQIKISAKDVSGLSFSDHQPVVAKLNLNLNSYAKTFDEIVNDSYQNDDLFSLELGENGDTGVNSYHNVENKPKNQIDTPKNSLQKLGAKFKQILVDEHIKPLQLKQIATNMLQFQFPINPNQTPFKKLKKSSLVHDIDDLLSEYINENKPTFKYYAFFMFLFLFLVGILLFTVKFFVDLTSIETFLILLILFIVCTIVIVLKFLTFRQEMNAIKAILYDIHKKKSFCTEFGLLGSE